MTRNCFGLIGGLAGRKSGIISASMNDVLNSFADPVAKALPKLPVAILAFAVGVLILHLVLWIIENILSVARTPRALHNIISSITQVLLWVILIAAVFQSLGLTQVALTLSGSVAILGVALGAGANALVQDIIAGLFLARDNHFDVGMRIKTGDVEGVIRRIDVRKVRIEDDAGNIHVLPNSSLDKISWTLLAEKSVKKNKS